MATNSFLGSKITLPDCLLSFSISEKKIEVVLERTAFCKSLSILAIGLPRGFGKTTVVKLYILFLVLFTNKRFILITALNQDKAKAILRDVDLLLTSPNIRALFGNIKADSSSDNKEEKQFTYKDRIITIKALGAGGDPRGSNAAFARPDVIISDDLVDISDGRVYWL